MAEPSDPNKPIEKELSGRIGKYDILRALGKGAMGQVYLAHDTMLDRDVALKVMVAQIADDPELKARFEREARSVAKMTHPNVVMVFDLGNHTDGSPFIAMELLKGQDLQKAVRQTPPMTLERKVAVIIQVLKGLAHAHQAGIVHRDIKPANIFIQENDEVKIMDFGVAHVTAASMTGTGNVVGTADYMSPEQVQGKKVDGRSDLFSVGCMLFELAAGRRPFHSDNLMAIFYKITHEDANFDLIPQGADYDALMPILKKALAKNLADRYQTAEEFNLDLREWLKAHATTASSQNVLEALVDLEAPTHAPMPMTQAPGLSGEGGATVDLGPGRRPGAPRRGTMAPTRVGGSKTVVDAGAGSTMRPGATRVIAAPPIPRTPPRAQPQPRQSVLPWVAMGLALVAVGVAGYLAWKSQQAPPQPVVQATPAPTPPPATLATPAPPPVAAAPAPEFGEAGGKAAASVRVAQAAFESGNYDKAVAAAQAALREDGESQPAKKILDQAIVGQKSADQVRTGDTALGRGDLAAAEAAAAEAYRIAPWNNRAVALQRRIAEAKAQAQRDAEGQAAAARSGQVNAALNEASSALQNKQYEAAIAAYERALALDPGNAAAQTGRQAAIGSKSLADAAASGGTRAGGGPVKSFVPGRTEAKAAASAGLVGFEDTAGVTVKQGTQGAGLPGNIVFEATPQVPKAGEAFKVVVYLSNEGSQPIPLSSMTVATTVDGKVQRGAVPPATATGAPRQRSVVFQVAGQVWKEGTQSWSMEIVLTTQRNETYRNTLTWK
ncbi:MAG TPA: protein kinase [Vicinamibacteria bacterium]|nr:protein kinase [Vicinamibacteria bacterium]